nr:hypothetical protein [Tanacetum cinerariifolium]GEY18992.1 hypothetical protein [Tanacetum cinerariifolium]
VQSSFKRKVKIPIKFGDTICELNKKKDECGNNIDNAVNEAFESFVWDSDGLVEDLVEDDRQSLKTDENHGSMVDDRHDDSEDIREKSVGEFPSLVENNEYKSELKLIPTGFKEGREVLLFDEELINEGYVIDKHNDDGKSNNGNTNERKGIDEADMEENHRGIG